MPESIFKQISSDILRLHRDSVYSLLATSGCNCQVHEAAYVNIDGKYYIALSCEPEVGEVKTGILLIEDESRSLRLSWVGSARELDRKDNAYKRPCLRYLESWGGVKTSCIRRFSRFCWSWCRRKAGFLSAMKKFGFLKTI